MLRDRDDVTKFSEAARRPGRLPATPATPHWLAELEDRERRWRGRPEHEIRREMERLLERRLAGRYFRVGASS